MRNLHTSLLLAASIALKAQEPDGSDINRAIPIYFGQEVNEIGDAATRPAVVYSISLARGQEITVTANKPANRTAGAWTLYILRPQTLSIRNLQSADRLYCYGNDGGCLGRSSDEAITARYQVAAAGVYFVALTFAGNGINYNLTVGAVGTPLQTALPNESGCLQGQVDSITYSLRLIAMNLPDEASIGGNRICSSCPVKPPLYPEIVAQMKDALKSNLNVEACFDTGGNIFKIKLLRP